MGRHVVALSLLSRHGNAPTGSSVGCGAVILALVAAASPILGRRPAAPHLAHSLSNWFVMPAVPLPLPHSRENLYCSLLGL